MYKYQEGVIAKFNGVNAKVEFDRVVSGRNLNTLRDVPDKEIVKLVYKLRSSTAEQIITIIGKQFKVTKNKIEEKIRKAVDLRLITRYKLEYNTNGFKRETDNIYMLDVNGKNLIEGEDLQKLEWDQKDNLSIKTHPEVHLKHIITNQLLMKYFEHSSTFYSYEVKPRLYFRNSLETEYIRPDVLVNFGNDEQQVHFIIYALRRNRGWKDELLKIAPYIEKLYTNFKPMDKLKQEPILMFICEDEGHTKEVCAEIDKTKISLSYTVYTYDDLIDTKSPENSIAIAKKDDNGEFVLEYPELVALV
ncbi:MAG TPA: hypothetical protein DEP72_06230 [Clostridiales bacterium]|nr:MAG: hypothetical protein A2Y18_00025 [Clostridiales bacterium GWD2_32_19]HCC07737.1 hypothetical protein [Clostridiales bacterium]